MERSIMAQEQQFLPRSGLQALLGALQQQGWCVHGPQWRDGAMLYAPLESVEALPRGLMDEQAPGHYRIQQTDSVRHFAWATGPQALKPLLFTPRQPLWRSRRDAQGRLHFEAVPAAAGQKAAVLGVRACDLAALALQDQHFLHGPARDAAYAARREALFIIAVNCVRSAATCFCSSTGDGPAVVAGCDLLLDELEEGFVVRAGSTAGEQLLLRLPLRRAAVTEIEAARAATASAAAMQTRRLPAVAAGALYARLRHPAWQAVGERCLSCGNCTSVCPSCFCSRELEQPALGGVHSEHQRLWDSCFSPQHAAMHGFDPRPDAASRYRQWLTHKLDGWQAQYGRSGCVGCGRCISWCPVGIDLTVEAAAVLAEDAP
jgi:ferredoxin